MAKNLWHDSFVGALPPCECVFPVNKCHNVKAIRSTPQFAKLNLFVLGVAFCPGAWIAVILMSFATFQISLGVGGNFYCCGIVQCPLLCKEFIIDAWQIYKARVSGADVVLLIAAVLPDQDLAYMVKIAKALGMAALIEVCNILLSTSYVIVFFSLYFFGVSWRVRGIMKWLTLGNLLSRLTSKSLWGYIHLQHWILNTVWWDGTLIFRDCFKYFSWV